MNFISTFDELNKLYEEVEAPKNVAFMDFTGSSEAFKDVYEKRIKVDKFEGEVKSVTDAQMKAVCDAVNAGDNVTLYTCDDDYKINCKSIIGKKNFKVITVVKESTKEACKVKENFENTENGAKSWTDKSINFYTQAAKELGLENLEMKETGFGSNVKVIVSAVKDGKKLSTEDSGAGTEVKDVADAKEYLSYIFALEESCDKKKLTEATEDDEIEIVDDEVPAEELAEEDPKQVIIECSKCGALIIKDEADIVVDEESDLVNVEDECKFCEETEGFKIIGAVAPYEVAEPEEPSEPAVEDVVEESLEETGNESIKELFDASINVDAENFGGNNNKVSILNPGLESVDAKKLANTEEDPDLKEIFDAKLNINAKDFGGSGNDVGIL